MEFIPLCHKTTPIATKSLMRIPPAISKKLNSTHSDKQIVNYSRNRKVGQRSPICVGAGGCFVFLLLFIYLDSFAASSRPMNHHMSCDQESEL